MNILKLLIISLLISQIFALQGNYVSCKASGCDVPTSCPAPPTATPTLSWVNYAVGACAINSCPTSGATISGAFDLYCKSCPGTPNGNVQAVFANTSGNACVAATATCGATRAQNSWTDADCLACNGNTSQYAKADQSGCQATPVGAFVTCQGVGCSTQSCITPPTATPSLSWVPGKQAGICVINACPASGATISGASDLYCKSCPGTPNGNVQAVFANALGNACVASTGTCGATRVTNTWTDGDCLACNGNTSQYAKGDRSGCQATPLGADVSCAGTGCATPANCPAPPTATPNLSWVSGRGTGKCAISSCPPYGTPINGATDLYCQSCPGTPNGNVKAVFANILGNACVAAIATCGANRTANTWTDADCLVCNGNTSQYANADKSGCQATPIGADVSCAGTGCATPANCPAPPTATPNLSWVTGTGSGKCAINACLASGSTISGATDLYCQSCPGTSNGSVQAVFANASGNACVASTGTCGASRTANTWTNADCLVCNGNTNQYAKSDKSGCQSTAPSSSQYSNSMIILSSVLFLITFLF